MKSTKSLFLIALLILMTCSSNEAVSVVSEDPPLPKTYNLLSLGDSYTIGQSVCETCRFPKQLQDSLQQRYTILDTFNLNIIAQTGWTTTQLKNAIASENLDTNYDLVTLLIGVNNQFQGKPFSLYEIEFPELIQTAITLAKGDKTNLIVLSIPDYGYTPFGQNNQETISSELDTYNNFAELYCMQNNISYVTITDITRLGLEQPTLVASDGLHPSELAYTKFVERLLPIVLEKVQ